MQKQSRNIHKVINAPAWANRLRDARRLTGMGPTEFARKIGLSQQRYSNYERGEREPNIHAWQAITSNLPVSLDFIILGRVGVPDQKNKQ